MLRKNKYLKQYNLSSKKLLLRAIKLLAVNLLAHFKRYYKGKM